MAIGFDFGLPLGLAYQHDYQQDIKNRAMLQQMRRQKEIDQKAEAQLWAKELETATVQNPFDSAGLEKHLDGHFKKMGKWLQEHPNFRTDPVEYTYWTKNFVRPIKDNEYVKRDLAFQQQKKLYSAYVAEHGEGDEHAEEMTRQKDNYRNTGNIDGDPSAGVKEFMFTAPYDGFDPMEIISSSYKKLQPGNKNSTRDPLGNYWFNTTHEENTAWGTQIANDPTLKRHWTKYWNSLDPAERLADNLPEHIAKLGAPFVVPKTKNLPRTSGGSGKGSTTNQGQGAIWDRDNARPLDADLARGVEFPITPASPERMNAVMQDAEGRIEIKDGSIMGIFNRNDAGTENVKHLGSPFTGYREGHSTGRVTKIRRGGAKQYLAELEVFVGLDEMEDLEGVFAKQWHEEGLTGEEQINPLDYDFLETWGTFQNPDEINDVHIRKQYKDVIRIAPNEENPDEIRGYYVKTWVPVDMQTEYNRRLYENTVVTKPKGEYPEQYGMPDDAWYDAESNSWFVKRNGRYQKIR